MNSSTFQHNNEGQWFRAKTFDLLTPQSFPDQAIDVQIVQGHPVAHRWHPQDAGAWRTLAADLPLASVGWIGHRLDSQAWYLDEELEAERLERERERMTPSFTAVEFYSPLAHSNLHRDFASGSVFSFPQQFGPIGPLFKVIDQEGDVCWSEMDAVWEHQQGHVKRLLFLWDKLRDRSAAGREALESIIQIKGARALLRWSGYFPTSWLEEFQPVAVMRALPQLVTSTQLFNPPMDAGRLIRFAAYALLEANLSHFIRQDCIYSISLRRGMSLSLVPLTLRGAIYMSLLREITGEAPTSHQCPVCGKWFIPEHGRQKYCSQACNQRAYHKRKKINALDKQENNLE